MVSSIALASGALYRPRPEAGAHSFAESELDVFGSVERLRNESIAQKVASQFLPHRQLGPDNRDPSLNTPTQAIIDLRPDNDLMNAQPIARTLAEAGR
jgi:hypothetical protein